MGLLGGSVSRFVNWWLNEVVLDYRKLKGSFLDASSGLEILMLVRASTTKLGQLWGGPCAKPAVGKWR